LVENVDEPVNVHVGLVTLVDKQQKRGDAALHRNARGMLSHGSTAFAAPSVGFCLGSANLISELWTTTVSGHSCSIPGWRGHYGKLRRARRHDNIPDTVLLPITSTVTSILTPSLAVMTALASFSAASEFWMSAGGWEVGRQETFHLLRSRLKAGWRVWHAPAAAAALSSSSSSHCHGNCQRAPPGRHPGQFQARRCRQNQ